MTEKNPHQNTHHTLRVVMYGYDDTQIFDITGPLEVFSRCSHWLMDYHSTTVQVKPKSMQRRAMNDDDSITEIKPICHEANKAPVL